MESDYVITLESEYYDGDRTAFYQTKDLDDVLISDHSSRHYFIINIGEYEKTEWLLIPATDSSSSFSFSTDASIQIVESREKAKLDLLKITFDLNSFAKKENHLIGQNLFERFTYTYPALDRLVDALKQNESSTIHLKVLAFNENGWYSFAGLAMTRRYKNYFLEAGIPASRVGCSGFFSSNAQFVESLYPTIDLNKTDDSGILVMLYFYHFQENE
jgi:hypothetical protein